MRSTPLPPLRLELVKTVNSRKATLKAEQRTKDKSTKSVMTTSPGAYTDNNITTMLGISYKFAAPAVAVLPPAAPHPHRTRRPHRSLLPHGHEVEILEVGLAGVNWTLVAIRETAGMRGA
jgi:hypothetical protein